jgi:hypothetical protein
MRSAIMIAGLAAVAVTLAAAQTPSIGVVTRNAGDSATVATNGPKVLVSITSPRGIGAATLERKGDRWPALSVRLNLRGLESVKITGGRVALMGAVSSTREGGQRLSVSIGGKEESSIDRSSVYWTDIRAFDERGRAITSLPPQGGWFELDIPAALLDKELQSVQLEWIDFYR